MINLRQFMFDKSLKQNDLAKMLGEQQSAISMFVNGYRKMQKRHIDELVSRYGEEEIAKYIISDEAFAPKQTTATIVPFEVVEELKREREGVPYEDYIADIRRKDAQLTDLIAEIRNFSERENRLISIIEQKHK